MDKGNTTYSKSTVYLFSMIALWLFFYLCMTKPLYAIIYYTVMALWSGHSWYCAIKLSDEIKQDKERYYYWKISKIITSALGGICWIVIIIFNILEALGVIKKEEG